ncbi:MAG: 50S ribosomal protein L17 [Phycisphaeraceae bacterium]|nr:50S ribosomal protein L17 [Phycisphaeraceae bacterium]
MRHRVAGYKLGRDSEHRLAMRRNMAIAFFTHGQITTTLPRAKSVQPLVEKLITIAKRGSLHARRQVIQALGNPFLVDFDVKTVDPAEVPQYKINRYGELTRGPRVVQKIFNEIAPSYSDRQGGYTRIVKLARRRVGDGGALCVLQLVGKEEGPQVAGQFSRRRDKANHRMEYAAKLRKAKAAEPAAPASA